MFLGIITLFILMKISMQILISMIRKKKRKSMFSFIGKLYFCLCKTQMKCYTL
jgi:hypothetical protein